MKLKKLKEEVIKMVEEFKDETDVRISKMEIKWIYPFFSCSTEVPYLEIEYDKENKED